MCGLFGYTHGTTLKDTILIIGANKHRGARRLGAVMWSRSMFTYENPEDPSLKPLGFPDAIATYLSSGMGDYVLGHWQQPTGADVYEAHPFRSGDWFVAHNGHIHNSDEILDELGVKGWPWATDSSCIAHLLNHTSGDWSQLKRLEGIFACWAYNIRTQDAYLFRWGPMIYIAEDFRYFSSIRISETDKPIPEGVVLRWPQNDNKRWIIVGEFSPNHHPYK